MGMLMMLARLQDLQSHYCSNSSLTYVKAKGQVFNICTSGNEPSINPFRFLVSELLYFIESSGIMMGMGFIYVRYCGIFWWGGK